MTDGEGLGKVARLDMVGNACDNEISGWECSALLKFEK